MHKEQQHKEILYYKRTLIEIRRRIKQDIYKIFNTRKENWHLSVLQNYEKKTLPQKTTKKKKKDYGNLIVSEGKSLTSERISYHFTNRIRNNALSSYYIDL